MAELVILRLHDTYRIHFIIHTNTVLRLYLPMRTVLTSTWQTPDIQVGSLGYSLFIVNCVVRERYFFAWETAPQNKGYRHRQRPEPGNNRRAGNKDPTSITYIHTRRTSADEYRVETNAQSLNHSSILVLSSSASIRAGRESGIFSLLGGLLALRRGRLLLLVRGRRARLARGLRLG